MGRNFVTPTHGPLNPKMNTLENRSGKPETTTNQRKLVRTITGNPPGNIQLNDNTQINKRYVLPSVLLSNLQSFGRSVKNDKITDLETTLNLNNVDIACITETMLSDNLINYISFNDYTSFHSVRQDTMRASGGVSIFVKDHLPVKRLNCGAPNIEHL